ncbi:MAG TPA: trypsin-like peptidase domain-containing protein [Pyrinomonadaceae bacterium]|nr:trypsin-like peptidase domain-containing protein [Pyrinomonadaceae bacterium]
MASSLVIHIAAGEDKHTEVLSQERIRIGSGEDCDLRLRASVFGPAAGDDAPRLVLELARSNGHYRVKDFDQSLDLTHNGKPLSAGAKIKDGDEVRYEPAGLALSFFPVRDLPAVVVHRQQTQVAPFIENAAIESRATTRRDDAKIFLREFTRELVREIRPTTKILTLLISLALVGGVLYLGFGLYNELKTSRRVSDDLRGQVGQLKDQISKTNSEIKNLDESNQNILDSLSLAPKLRSDYGGGVCMILSSYDFVETGTGRPLRYPEVQTNEDGTVIQGGEEQAQLTPEGAGTIAEFQSVGSGFHVGGGYVLTNRHVAQPWLADERAQILNSSVRGQPRLRKLVAYFPDHTQPITLKFRVASQREDLAVCVFDAQDAPTDLPVLPLDRDAAAAAVGKTVVLMGYPNGPDRLLALRDDAEAYMIRARCGASLESLLGCLSEKNRIQPLTTQGNITDLDVHRVVYDARTAEGGSGAPLFGQSGRVIGVNFAIFTENTASNFAVPIRYAFKLLERGGWVEPVPPAEANQDAGENSNQAAAAAPRAGGQPPANSSRPER